MREKLWQASRFNSFPVQSNSLINIGPSPGPKIAPLCACASRRLT